LADIHKELVRLGWPAKWWCAECVHIHVKEAIIIEVAKGNTLAKKMVIHPSFGCDVFEAARAIILIQHGS